MNLTEEVETEIIELEAEDDFNRLDIFIAEGLNISRNKASNLISNLYVTKQKDFKLKLKSSTKVFKGDTFLVEIPESPNINAVEPEDIAFDVIYEDEFLIVINKPSGLVVHPAPGHYEHTLVNGLVYRYPEMKLMTQRARPGIVHRLDAGTSGLMIVARSDEALIKLQKLFVERTIDKQYIALIHGVPKQPEGIISAPLGRDPFHFAKICARDDGKPAMTGYKVLWTTNSVSMVLCKLFTGRTHQIRAHFSGLHCPLVGDTLYGANDTNLPRFFLHSWKLEFIHPFHNKLMKFRQNIPEDFVRYIRSVF